MYRVMLFQKYKIICLLCLQIITIMLSDTDPNVFQFELTCLICQSVEHSQGNLKCHFNEWGCRKFLISCGCCGIVYDRAHDLASHLNARGAVGRDSFYPPGLAVSIDTAIAALYSSSSVVNFSSSFRPPSTAPAALGRDPDRSPPATLSVSVSSSSAILSVPVSSLSVPPSSPGPLRCYRQTMRQLRASSSLSSTSSALPSLPAVCMLSTTTTPVSSSSRSVRHWSRHLASTTTDPYLSSVALSLPVITTHSPPPIATAAVLSRLSTPSPLSVSDTALSAADVVLSTSDFSDLDCIQEESHPAASLLQDVQVDSGRTVSVSPSTFLNLPSTPPASSPPVIPLSPHRGRSRSHRLPRARGRSSCHLSSASGSHTAPCGVGLSW